MTNTPDPVEQILNDVLSAGRYDGKYDDDEMVASTKEKAKAQLDAHYAKLYAEQGVSSKLTPVDTPEPELREAITEIVDDLNRMARAMPTRSQRDYSTPDKSTVDQIMQLISQHTATAVSESRIDEALKEAKAALEVAKSGSDMLMVRYLGQRVQSLEARLQQGVKK